MDQALASLQQELAALKADMGTIREEARASREAEVRATRKARLAGTLSCTLIAAGATLLASMPTRLEAAGPGNVVNAPFTVLGRGRKPILKVAEGPNGGVLTMFDPAGGRLIQVGTPQTGRGLTVFDDVGVPIFQTGIRFGDGGAPRRTVQVFDEEGSPATRMEHGVLLETGNDFSSINVLRGGERLIEIGIDPDDNVLGMTIQRNDNEPLLAFGELGGRVGMAFFDPLSNQPAIELGVDASIAERGIRVLGVDNNPLAVMGAFLGDPVGGRLELFNTAGTPTFAAP